MPGSDKDIEILAPAGNMSALKAAVACGANAVYLGSGNFNARSKADNFTDEGLRLAVLYCHERGVKVYLTVNTLVKKSELEDAVKTVRKSREAGVDAYLVQDLGLFMRLRSEFPDISLHASTQLGIHNLPGAKYAEKMGFDRIVLSREVLSSDIKSIHDNTSLEIEAFVHGAHCISFSGNCYFSSLVSGYSGNRGKCLQLCRKKYSLGDGKRSAAGYMLSAKDMCLLKDVQELAPLGVTSFKIEGRLRSAEYAGIASETYAKALCGKATSDDEDRLKTVFNRGDFSHAYIREDRPDIVYPAQQNNIGRCVGKIKALRGKEAIPDRAFRPTFGDGFKILRKGRECGSASVISGRIVCNGSAAVGDEIRLTKSGALEKYIAGKVKSSEKQCEADFQPTVRKNQSSIPRIVRNRYVLPEKCKILIADERTPEDILRMAERVIFSPCTYDIATLEHFSRVCEIPFLLDMPVEARGRDVDIMENLVKRGLADGYVANNIYALEMCENERVLLGMGMNCLSGEEDPHIMSIEAAYSDKGAAIYAYGRAVLMNLTHCPLRQLKYTCSNCSSAGKPVLTDEMSNKMPLRRRREHYCYWELLNGKVQNLLPKLDRHKDTRIVIDSRDVPIERVRAALERMYDLDFDQAHETYGRYGKGVK